MEHYFVLSRQPDRKLTHDLMISTICGFYPKLTYQIKIDFPTGFSCKFENGIAFELNKWDMDTDTRNIGQDRVKNKSHPKNGYLLALPEPNDALVCKLGGIPMKMQPPRPDDEVRHSIWLI